MVAHHRGRSAAAAPRPKRPCHRDHRRQSKGCSAIRRSADLKAQGGTYAAIAAALNASGTAKVTGKAWAADHVRKLLAQELNWRAKLHRGTIGLNCVGSRGIKIMRRVRRGTGLA